jgi:hypothetical protein
MDTFYPKSYAESDALMTYIENLLDRIPDEGVEVVDREALANLSNEAYEDWLLALKDYQSGEEK